ncbi:MAG: hypothetical protein ACOX8W_01055 [bacterium]|jgi:hypothetical protein
MQRRRFAEKFALQAVSVERVLVRLLTVGFCLLVTAQCLLLPQQTRRHLSYVHWAEGEEIVTGPVLTESEMHISITLLADAPNAAVQVLVNGKPAGDFRENPLFVPVNFGDIIAVDGTRVTEKIQFRLGSLPANVDTENLHLTGSCQASVFLCGQLVRRQVSP